MDTTQLRTKQLNKISKIVYFFLKSLLFILTGKPETMYIFTKNLHASLFKCLFFSLTGTPKKKKNYQCFVNQNCFNFFSLFKNSFEHQNIKLDLPSMGQPEYVNNHYSFFCLVYFSLFIGFFICISNAIMFPSFLIISPLSHPLDSSISVYPL